MRIVFGESKPSYSIRERGLRGTGLRAFSGGRGKAAMNGLCGEALGSGLQLRARAPASPGTALAKRKA
ncbi:MAG: hypothetical protein LAT68_06075 [Cyclobacteriaceae bacterium]|nr:hypothetical protein [Cyclobacteriaceae bacterium]